MTGLPPLAVVHDADRGPLPDCVTAAGWVTMPPQGLRARVLAFDADRFDDLQFARHGVACPPRVRASVARRRCEFLCGRLAAAGALAALGRVDHAVGTGSAGEPVWPAGVAGSVSHVDGLAVVLARDDAGGRCRIGLDIERVLDADALHAATSVALSPDEAQRLRAACGSGGGVPFAQAATAAFCAKEAFYKLVHADVRRLLDFDAVSIEGAHLPAGRMSLRVAAALPGAIGAGRRLTAHAGRLPGGEVMAWIAWPADAGWSSSP